MRVLGLDPGPVQSALVVLGDRRVLHHWIDKNQEILDIVGWWAGIQVRQKLDDTLVIEQIANMGMPAVGDSVFETAHWSGRFAQVWDDYSFNKPFHRLKRHEVKSYLCHSQRAKDANIRQALIDLFGGESAIGRKSSPGPLYGFKGDEWSALAVAVTWQSINAPTAILAAGKGHPGDSPEP